MSAELDLSSLVDADVVAGVLEIHPNYVRQLAKKGVIRYEREEGSRRMWFRLTDVIEDMETYYGSKSEKRSGGTASDEQQARKRVPDDRLLLWNKRVKRLGWAIASVHEQDAEDNFVMIEADSGLTTPATITRILDEVAEGKIYILEPGQAIELVLRQLYKNGAPPEATDCLEAAKRVLTEWRRKRLEEIDVADQAITSS